MSKNLEEKIYSMSNSFLPLDMFYNDIRDNKAENYNKEQAYKDLEIIADFISDLQSQIDQLKQQLEDEKKLHSLAKAFYDEKQAEFDKLLYDYNKLKQQLAEKDKEINSLILDYEKRISQEQKLMSNMEHLLTEKTKRD